MPTCTEVAIAKLQNPSTKIELEKNDAHKHCLQTVTSQPGCLGIRWDVLVEDDTVLVWLVGWESMEHHTEGFVKSDAYKPFLEEFHSILDAEKPITAITHYAFNPPPPQALTEKLPMVELLEVSVNDMADMEIIDEVLQPLKDLWKKEDNRQASSSPALDKDVEKMMFFIPWASLEQHSEARTPFMRDHVGRARSIWKEITFVGHVKP